MGNPARRRRLRGSCVATSRQSCVSKEQFAWLFNTDDSTVTFPATTFGLERKLLQIGAVLEPSGDVEVTHSGWTLTAKVAYRTLKYNRAGVLASRW